MLRIMWIDIIRMASRSRGHHIQSRLDIQAIQHAYCRSRLDIQAIQHTTFRQISPPENELDYPYANRLVVIACPKQEHQRTLVFIHVCFTIARY